MLSNDIKHQKEAFIRLPKKKEIKWKKCKIFTLRSAILVYVSVNWLHWYVLDISTVSIGYMICTWINCNDIHCYGYETPNKQKVPSTNFICGCTSLGYIFTRSFFELICLTEIVSECLFCNWYWALSLSLPFYSHFFLSRESTTHKPYPTGYMACH